MLGNIFLINIYDMYWHQNKYDENIVQHCSTLFNIVFMELIK
jgi:hypothetical protein